jgi:hypothetical protein
VLVPAWREGGALFDDTERAALAWAETVTGIAETGVPDAEYEAAADVLGRKQLADLTIAIGLMNAYNRMAISFRARRLRLSSSGSILLKVEPSRRTVYFLPPAPLSSPPVRLNPTRTDQRRG